jgi:AraC-like DNA-binding protein
MTFMPRRYVHAVAHSFRLDTAPLLTTRSLRGPQVSVAHIACGPAQFGVTETIPPEDTFVVAINLTEVHYYELWSKGHPFIVGGFVQNSMRIGNLKGKFHAHILHPLESVAFEIPRASLESLADEEDIRRVAGLSCPHNIVDPTMASIVRALLPALIKPQEASAIFVDHVIFAALTHLVQRYGDGISDSATMTRSALSRAQIRHAKEMLEGNLKGNLLVADLAKECGVSRQYFIKTFREMVGCPPHQWLQWRRVDRAKKMLRIPTVPISEIAVECGFADQSHLTRVFSALTGATPAVWRRQNSRFQG